MFKVNNKDTRLGGGSNVNSVFHSSEVDQLSTRTPGDLLGKSELSPRSDSAALTQLNCNHKKGL